VSESSIRVTFDVTLWTDNVMTAQEVAEHALLVLTDEFDRPGVSFDGVEVTGRDGDWIAEDRAQR
jgi:hypothetical protein